MALEKEDPKASGEGRADEKGLAKRPEILAKAHSVVVLFLGDNVLRERLYSYKFLEEKRIGEQLEEFNKAVNDLENIDVTLDDEDKAIILLNALPSSYDQLKDTMMYGCEKTITLLEVQYALKAKELQKAGPSKTTDSITESLNVKKFKGKKFNKKKGEDPKVPSQDQKETRSCHWFKKPEHLKKDCYSWKKKQAMQPEQ